MVSSTAKYQPIWYVVSMYLLATKQLECICSNSEILLTGKIRKSDDANVETTLMDIIMLQGVLISFTRHFSIPKTFLVSVYFQNNWNCTFLNMTFRKWLSWNVIWLYLEKLFDTLRCVKKHVEANSNENNTNCIQYTSTFIAELGYEAH
jgi:hypothetical protein